MRITNPNTYVQYVTKNGHIKVKELDRSVEANEIIYNLSGVQEDFFLLGLYDTNKRVLGLTFGNVQNLDMIAFLNSEFQSIDALPEMAFLPAYIDLSIVKDTTEYDINFDVVPPVVPLDFSSLLRQENKDIHPLYGLVPPSRYYVELNPLAVGKPLNLNIEGFSLHCNSMLALTSPTQVLRKIIYYDEPSENPVGFSDQSDFDINVQPLLKNGTFFWQQANWNGPQFSTSWLGFNFVVLNIVPTAASVVSFKFLLDKQYNIFDVVTHSGGIVTYLGSRGLTHIWKSDNIVIFCAYEQLPVTS
jgi:hypothetical protein